MMASVSSFRLGSMSVLRSRMVERPGRPRQGERNPIVSERSCFIGESFRPSYKSSFSDEDASSIGRSLHGLLLGSLLLSTFAAHDTDTL